MLDGAGNLWLTTGGSFGTGIATGIAAYNGTVNFSTWLVEISPTGSLLSPYNAGTGVYGYQPTGLGMNGSANVTGQPPVVTVDPGASLLGVDNSGNIWALDLYTRRVLKIPGLATPNALNY